MLFSQDGFAPDRAPHPDVRAWLAGVGPGPGGAVRCTDLLAAAFASGNPAVRDLASAGVSPAHASGPFVRALLGRGGGPAAPPGRAGFDPDAVAVLDQFGTTLGAAGGALDGVAPEVLLYFLFTALPEPERGGLPPIDYARTAAFFHDRVSRALARESPVGEGPDEAAEEEAFAIPPELAPSEDLTRRVGDIQMAEPPPFDGDPAYDLLFDRVARALHRRQHNHVLLVGEPGVGKTTLVVELARRAASGRIGFLRGARFLSVDCRHVLPEESRPRLAALLRHLAPRPDLVACIDGLATLLRGDRGATNRPLFLAALARSRCRYLGSLTPREYEELVADDLELAEHFTRVDAHEPDADTALRLLRHFARGLEARYGTPVDDDAVRQAVLLTANYVLNDQLPAKALKVLRRVCEDVDYARAELGQAGGRVTADGVVAAVAEASGVPAETLRGVAGRTDYEAALGRVVFGQDQAVREVATELGLIKAGMTDPGKPASVMLFLGQTGTGKTEMAKALARFYSSSRRLRTYTLGNCVEPHSVATIIGVPPGYVGSEHGGRLVNELNADPYCVFLLDEADKAHPDVLQPFLNLFDEGWVADQRGVRGYAGRSIFVLTTNVGQRMIAEMVAEGRTAAEIQARMKEVLGQIRHTKADRPVFTPEFLARVKRVIVFNPLGREAMLGIAARLVAETEAAWGERRGKRLVIDPRLAEALGEGGHQANERAQGREGGRVVRKLLAEWVEAPVQRRASADPEGYRRCREVRVSWAGEQGKRILTCDLASG